MADANLEGDIIILEHSPDIFPVVTGENSISKRTKLFLAGHTHGGQVWFPILGSLIVPSDHGDKYAFGHVRENGTDMFVTTGVGMSVFPVRFLVPPEIAVLTIRSR
ncbi:MAG: metallophosphoesterase [Pyrinomonadaceae bacterium]|nr:metallophosphoesterase [Pyrinomonadaceae bacterium]